jgi:putative ABC transport system permease protein
MKYLSLIFRNIRRNLVRSTLTALGTMVLVLVVTLVWSVLDFLQKATTEKSANIKAIVSEKWQFPSQMPFSYAGPLSEGGPREKGDYRIKPDDSMTWQFYAGSLVQDPKQRNPMENMFAFAMEPRKIMTMMDDLDDLPNRDPKAAEDFKKVVDKMEKTKNGLIVGKDRLAAMKKQVGDKFMLYSINYKGIDLEFEIVGVCPPGRYDPSSFMRRDYLLNALDSYERTNKKKHPLAEKTLGLVWVRVPDQATFQQVAKQITTNPSFSSPAVKVETSSSGIGAFLDAYRDLFWGMRYLLAPAIWVTLSLVISNAISISVRERRLEFAVLKVLGFRPGHILWMVLGEALLLGLGAGLLSAGATWYLVNKVMIGIKFPIAFFPAFFIPIDALWWGVMVGGVAALAGSLLPAWSARTVKVSDVFAKIA